MCAFMGKAPAKPTACPCLLLPPHGDPPHPFRPRGCDSALLVLWNCAAGSWEGGVDFIGVMSLGHNVVKCHQFLTSITNSYSIKCKGASAVHLPGRISVGGREASSVPCCLTSAWETNNWGCQDGGAFLVPENTELFCSAGGGTASETALGRRAERSVILGPIQMSPTGLKPLNSHDIIGPRCVRR